MSLDDIIKETQTYYCLECGKCSSLCPVSRYDPAYSPRVMVENALLGLEDDLVYNRELFSCLTCYACQPKCPADVDYPLFIQKMRAIASGNGEHGDCAHSGTIQSIMRLMTNPTLKQRRLDWLTDDCRIAEQSDVLFFVGCAPYFEHTFDFETQTIDIARDSIRVLNALGIEPMLLPNERCCGHDLLWTGDTDSFRRLADQNAAMIRESGAKKVIFACPEGYRTFKKDYPNFIDIDFEVQHIAEFIAGRIAQNNVELGEIRKRVTYHDPCRLGRHLDIYDPPRTVLNAIPGLELVEMEHNRDDSLCCGTSAFTNCDLYSKQIRIERLQEAKATGAEILVTTCPKCQIHFKCAMISKGEEKGPDVTMEVTNLVKLVARALEAKRHE
ncbi:(Fe-S)-binding protein [Chloroflexota bacterium]